MRRLFALRAAALAIASSAAIAQAQQPVVAVTNAQPVQVVAAAPAPVVVTPQAVAVAPVSVPSTVVHPVAGVNSLSASVTPQPTYAVTNTVPQYGAAQQTQIYTPTFYYYYYSAPYQAPAPQPSWQPMQVAPVAPMYPVAPIAPVAPVAPVALPAMPMYDALDAGYAGQFGPLFNARGEAGHVRYPYYSYRRPWYYPGQPSFNVTIPGPVW